MYEILVLISIMMLSADSESFWGWLVWELVWFIVFLYSASRVKMGGNDD